jgi:hypothetical protein
MAHVAKKKKKKRKNERAKEINCLAILEVFTIQANYSALAD